LTKDTKGGQIFDDAFCGGGDPTEGYGNTAVPLSAGAVSAIKAAIFMGDPRNIHGLPYNVGTCAAQGVSVLPLREIPALIEPDFPILIFFTSSIPARLALTAQAHPRSSRTAMPRTHIVATETIRPLTKVTARSTVSKPSLLSTASSHKKLCKSLGAYYPSYAMRCCIWSLRAPYSRRLWPPHTKIKQIIFTLQINHSASSLLTVIVNAMTLFS
jgi:hypothetical protein